MKYISQQTFGFSFVLLLAVMSGCADGIIDDDAVGQGGNVQTTEIQTGETGKTDQTSDVPRPGLADGSNGVVELTWPETDDYYCGESAMNDGNLDEYCVEHYGAGEIGYCYMDGDEEHKVCYEGCSVKGAVVDTCETVDSASLGTVDIHIVTECKVLDNHLVYRIADMRRCVHACDAAGKACD